MSASEGSPSTPSPNILICCIGSRGDVQPYLSFALHLRDVRHAKVTMAVHPEFEGWIRSHKVGYAPMQESMVYHLMNLPDGQNMIKGGFAAARSMPKFFNPLITSWFRDMVSAVSEVKPTHLILATFPFLCGGCAIANQFKVPYSIIHTVAAAPTSEFAPPSGGVGMKLPFGFLNRWMWYSGNISWRFLFKSPVLESMKKHNVPDNGALPNEQAEIDKAPILYIYSPQLLPKPADWGPQHHIVGYMELPQKAEAEPYVPPAELQTFIDDAGRENAPIAYVGFGSMLEALFTEEQGQNLFQAIIDGLQEARTSGDALAGREPGLDDLRVVLHTTRGKASLPLSRQPPEGAHIYVLTHSVPHTWLLPQMAAAVCHGGCGTTHAALRAGLAVVVVPCGATTDQPFWGDLIHRRGLGLCTETAAKMKVRAFSRMWRDLVRDLANFRARAGEIGKRMRELDGDACSNAAELILRT